jgi:hypothetical protein
MRLPPNTFLFEAQTGIVHWTMPLAPSNYKRYLLPARCIAKVNLAIDAAIEGSAGLLYDVEFLFWLEKNDKSSELP